MSSPSLKDLPKVALDLKSQLEGFNHDNMKKADTTEKIILPTAEGMYQNFNTFFQSINTIACILLFGML